MRPCGSVQEGEQASTGGSSSCKKGRGGAAMWMGAGTRGGMHGRKEAHGRPWEEEVDWRVGEGRWLRALDAIYFSFSVEDGEGTQRWMREQ